MGDYFGIFICFTLKSIYFTLKILVSCHGHSSNVYAVTRNIEDPAQMTPFIPVALEPNKEVPTVLEAEDEQVRPPHSGR